MKVNRLQWRFQMLLLAAGIAGGMFVAGCSGKDVRQEAVATVNGDPIKVGELREFLGAPAGVFAVPEIPVERKKEALDQLVSARLLAQEGRSLGIDNTPEFQQILQQNDPLVRIKALMRKEIEAKLKVTGEEIKAEIARVREADKEISEADAAMRAVRSLSGDRIQKIQEELIAAAKKETGATVDNQAVPRVGKEGSASDTVVPADGEQARLLASYAMKQGIDGTEGYRAMRREMERSILRDMVADDVVAKNAGVTEKEVDADFAKRTVALVPAGKKIPADFAATLKERIRGVLRKEKAKAAIDAYVAGLKSKAKITVNDAVLPKV